MAGTAPKKKPFVPKPPRKGRRRHPLGPFAFAIMRAIDNLPKDDCYGSMIEQYLKHYLGEAVDVTQIYIGLSRLEAEDKGFLTAKDRPSPTGADRTVAVYTITPVGRAAMNEAAAFYKALADL